MYWMTERAMANNASNSINNMNYKIGARALAGGSAALSIARVLGR
jgi:hypothetical protein